MIALPLEKAASDCWNTIGVRGDRSCPELNEHVHCQNCPVFAAAGRRFLDAPSPEGYLDEWTDRLAEIPETASCDTISVLVFRIADEWLALPIHAMVEVTTPRPVHRVPYRAGLLAGLVNIRGELHLCVHLSKVLGIVDRATLTTPAEKPGASHLRERYLVTHRASDRWVFPVDAVDQVCRIPRTDVQAPPATVKRAANHLSSGMFSWNGQPVGLLDDARVFDFLQRKLR
jgi:chemotaxis-related protein WspD